MNLDHPKTATDDELRTAAEEYARELADDTDLGTDLDAVRFEISGRMTKNVASVTRNKDSDAFTINLSRKAHEQRGVDVLADGVEIMLLYVESIQQHGGLDRGRVDARADALGFAKELPSATPPKYIVECTTCGKEYGRQQRSAVVKHPEAYDCGDCGSNTLDSRANTMT